MNRTVPRQKRLQTASGPSRLELICVVSPDPELEGRRLSGQGWAGTIGRSDDADVTARDPGMSRLHARLSFDKTGTRLEVTDLDSRNGVQIEGADVAQVRVPAGAVLRIGDSFFVAQPTPPAPPDRESRLKGVSSAIATVRERIRRCARRDLTVLIVGETGTGKEVACAEIHRLSGRPGALVPINCAAIPSGLAESALFGHLSGAFTGATASRTGAFVEANRGTLFLDEVGELPLAQQPKLLRVLEDRMVIPVGRSTGRRVDVRVVAATNVDVAQAAHAGALRRDLLARLEEWLIALPPLRERRADIPLLLRHFLRQAGARVEIAPSAWAALLRYDWPFNVRGLRKLARQLEAGVDPGGVVQLEDLPRALAEHAECSEGEAATERSPSPADLTYEVILQALVAARGNATQAARSLGCGRRTVYRRVEEFGIDLEALRGT